MKRHCSTPITNRQTTYNSLVGLVLCIYAENEEQFVAGYNAGTHDFCGHSCWQLMFADGKERKIYRGERP